VPTTQIPCSIDWSRVGISPLLLGGNLIISEAFGLFRRDQLAEAGGYQAGSVGEDMELVVRMMRQGHETGRPAKVEFTPDPVAWTEVPEDPGTLARQRNRWYRGLLEVLAENRRVIGRRRYGSLGTVGLPYFVLVEALAPILEICGLVLVAIAASGGWLTTGHVAAISLAYAMGLTSTIAVLVLDDIMFATFPGGRNRVRLVAGAFWEAFVLHPLTLVWRLQGLIMRLKGRSSWGAQVRRDLA
jgi:cellulose synthase/poly-beta-1,6-N-acetylglucosamine synthase-like glycosyltransferase